MDKQPTHRPPPIRSAPPPSLATPSRACRPSPSPPSLSSLSHKPRPTKQRAALAAALLALVAASSGQVDTARAGPGTAAAAAPPPLVGAAAAADPKPQATVGADAAADPAAAVAPAAPGTPGNPYAHQKPVKPGAAEPPVGGDPTAPGGPDDPDADLAPGYKPKPDKSGVDAAKDFEFPVLWNPATIKHAAVKYFDGQVNLTGYLAYGNGSDVVDLKRPVVLVIPDADGIGNYEKWRANLLAADGYVAMVPDLYGNKVLQGPAMAVNTRAQLAKTYVMSEGLLKGRLMTALNAVRTLPMAAQGQVAAVGWNFGGFAALQLFRASGETDQLQLVAAFHPSPMSIATSGAPMEPGAARLALFTGTDDVTVKAKDTAAFKAELDKAGAKYTWTQYSGVGAGFGMRDLPPRTDPAQKMGYDPIADVASWSALRVQLMQAFGLWAGAEERPFSATGGKADWQTGFGGSVGLGGLAPPGEEPVAGQGGDAADAPAAASADAEAPAAAAAAPKAAKRFADAAELAAEAPKAAKAGGGGAKAPAST
jgi:dienelactone hydrolase